MSRQENNGGTLVIPPGTYKVGGQTHGGSPCYAPREIFDVTGLGFLDIQGNGATIRLASGLRYGAFDAGGQRIPLSSRTSERAAVGGFVASKPGAGLDIEPNRGVPHEITRDGRFENREFVNNIGHGIEATNGDSRDNTFTNCVIWAVSDTAWTTTGGATSGAGHAI